MSRWKCNSCGGTYSDTNPDGTAYYHVCPSEVVTPAIVDPQGKVTTPEVRAPQSDVRDERVHPLLTWQSFQGAPLKPFTFAPNPEERGRQITVPSTLTIISEGKGRTQLA